MYLWHRDEEIYIFKVIYNRINIIRWIQVILCIICLTFNIIVYVDYFKPYMVPIAPLTILLFTVVSAFLFITFIDGIAWIVKNHISRKIWMMIALAAFLMFCLSVGVVAFINDQPLLFTLLWIFSLITAIVYLLDWLSLITLPFIYPDADLESRSTKVCPECPRAEKAVSTCYLYDPSEYECPAARRRKSKRPSKSSVTSYGGTFPVSKEDTPLPSPDNRGGAAIIFQDCRCVERRGETPNYTRQAITRSTSPVIRTRQVSRRDAFDTEDSCMACCYGENPDTGN